jgi:S1-C subfamily serine protease
MTAMDKYFVVEPGAEPHGPYPLPEIADLLAAGTVTPRAVLRKAGDASAPPRPTVIDVPPLEAASPPVAAEPAVVDHTNKIEPLDEGWEGETEIHAGAPAQAAPPPIPPSVSAPMGAPPGVTPHPHHRAARGTQPPPTAYPTQPSTALAVTADPRHRAEQHAAPPPFAPAPQAYAQPQLAKPAEDPPPVRDPKRRIAIGVGIGVAVAIGGIGLAIALSSPARPNVKDALVRVSTQTGTGTGFLIDGPDEYIYVATANHLVDRGERVLVERDVNVSEKKSYVEAYPETEIVATDPDADLAIIRIKNVDASRFSHLTLAKKPTKDAKILSYGYPGSSLASHPGLVSKDGKVLSIVSFPAYDERYARVLRDNAVDGLLISTDIEPGMSGGPTVNDDGEVVGINVTKDRAHVGQNGAVSVTALRDLVAKIKPASDHADPKPEDIVTLLDNIQSEYLLLPLDERSKIRETDFVHAGDLPNLRELVSEVRREERNTDSSFIAKYQLSGQAALGMFFARMPGKLLETYRAPSTTAPLVACELANERLTGFLGDLSQTADTPKPNLDNCDELAVRPLAWDLVAATLQWNGKEKQYTVTKIDKMDDEGKVYRASLKIAGASNLVELWFGMDQNKVRLKLFDAGGNLYAIKSPRTVAASSFQGTWSVKRPRVTDTVNKDAEIESSDSVSISITDDHKVAVRNVVTEHYFSAASSKGGAFRCSGKRTIETGLVQSFTGSLDNGVILAFPDKEAEEVGADAGYCKPSHKADRIAVIKLEGDQLTFYRSDGNAYPETVQLTKDVAPPPAPTPAPAAN